ncbi:MAG TPA: hypothetical protein VFI27_09475 [candidate division Zixibacteria bacterium]|nr:hypothetical protein [candidate division Zixibacteria bacterium]
MVKRILGVVGMVFGVLGILLAILAFVGVWAVNKPMKDGVVDLLEIADGALVRVEEVLARADNGLQEVRNFVSDTAEAIPGTELAMRIDNLFELVETAAEAADNANTVIGLANKTSGLLRRDAEERPIEKVSATLDNLATTLAEIDQRAKEFQERNVAAEIAAQIDGEIATVQDGVRDINSSVGEAQTGVDELKVAIPRWINIASVISSLIFIWMGVAQLALVGYGRQWFRVPPAEKVVEVEPTPVLAPVAAAVVEEESPQMAAPQMAAPEKAVEEPPVEEERPLEEEPVDVSEVQKEIQQHQDEAEKLIEARGRDNYEAAAGALVQAKGLYEELGQNEEWEAYIATLKERNSRLSALEEELEKAGL